MKACLPFHLSGLFCLFINTVLAKQICNLTLQHSVIDKSSDPGKVLTCVPCAVCGAGSEPKIKCGITIDVNQTIGDCEACRGNTFSPSKDVNECQSCDRNASHIVNEDKTACLLVKTNLNSTIAPPVKSKRQNEKTWIYVVIGVLCFIGIAVLIFYATIHYFRRQEQQQVDFFNPSNPPYQEEAKDAGTGIDRQESCCDYT